jgi:CRISPR/Cas system-associated exonuclease Cas4 (RecB family)
MSKSNYYFERNLPYKPGQKLLYKLSRSKIELFTQCPRCFWLDVRLKIKRPNGPPFQINKAIDELYKKEFDVFRAKKQPHPIMVENNVKAIPYTHEDLDKWRHNFTGVNTLHEPTNLYIFGAIDDVWIDEEGSLVVVDYKATSKSSEITIDADWQMSYKRQMEIYQWLLRKNGFEVSSRGYFVYTNARMDVDGFFDKLEFKTKLIPYIGNTDWVEDILSEIKKCMEGDIPVVGKAAMGGDCDFCLYAKDRTELTLKYLKNNGK